MQAVLGCNYAPCTILSRRVHGSRPPPVAIALGVLPPVRGCQLGCGASARPSAQTGLGRGRPSRRGAVVCNAAARNFYEILGVPPSASDRDIKSAYRKLAMKLHPDVNKAADAQQRFMEVKVAYETLSEPKQRAEYDRRLRMGYSSSGSRAGGSAGFGGAPSSGSRGPYGPYGAGPGYTQEPLPGLDELIRELEKEFTAWANSRGQGGRAKSLIEELEDLGGEFLDFLEESLGIKDEPAFKASSSGTARGSGSGARPQGGSGGPGAGSTAGGAREPRTAAEKFEALWEQFGDGTPFGSAAGSGAAAGSGGAGSGRSSGSGSTAAGRGSASPGSVSSTGSNSRSSGAQSKPPRSSDDDIEAQLQALKKKLNKL